MRNCTTKMRKYHISGFFVGKKERKRIFFPTFYLDRVFKYQWEVSIPFCYQQTKSRNDNVGMTL